MAGLTPPNKPPVPPTSPLYGEELVRYIVAGSAQRRLDPAAVLSIASVEGGFSGAVGDKGTSFGPFQLHIGGALPSSIAGRGSSYAREWSNTPVGVNYALDHIAGVAKGLSGLGAINAISSGFERPANVSGEVSNAGSRYVGIHRSVTAGDYKSISGGGPTGYTGGGFGFGGIGGAARAGAADAIGGVVPGAGAIGAGINAATGSVTGSLDAITKPIDAVKWFGSNWGRVAEVLGGFVLLALGGVMLSRQLVGQNTDLAKLVSGQVAGSARDKGYSEGFETGRMFKEEMGARKGQVASDRAAIRANKSSSTRRGYLDEVPY